MSTAPQTERRPLWQSPRFQSRLLWLSFVVLGAGVIVFVGARWSNTGTSSETPAPTVQKDVSGTPQTVKLSKEATAVARRFILTAVARKDLRTAWKLAGPQVRQGLTLKQWLKGEIPVVPYPIDSLAVARMKVDYAYENRALLEIALSPKKGSDIKPQTFFIMLIKIGPRGHKHWVVDGWIPRTSFAVPNARGD